MVGRRASELTATEARGGDVLLRVRVQPKASRNAFLVEPHGRVRVALTAPPVDGKANKALVAFVSKSLGLPRGNVSLESGMQGRDKVLRLSACSRKEIDAKLSSMREARAKA